MVCTLVFGSMERVHLQHHSEVQIHVIVCNSGRSERTPNEHHEMSAIKVQALSLVRLGKKALTADSASGRVDLQKAALVCEILATDCPKAEVCCSLEP